MTLYRLNALLVLPFRGWLPGSHLKASWHFLNDDWETETTLYYLPSFPIPVAPGQIDTSLSTIAEVSTVLPFEGDREAVKTWAGNHSADIVADRILPRLNDYLLQIKHTYPRAILTGTIRNIGDIDLVFSRLFLEGELVMARSGPAFPSFLRIPVPPTLLAAPETAQESGPAKPISLQRPSNEWVAITRAVDLVNHGYFAEAFVVGFALLDALVQEFVKGHLPNLSTEEAEAVVGRIASHRLKTLLGPVLRVCLNASPLNDKASQTELDWLNNKRNAILHRGDLCSRLESQRGLTAVWQFLRYLSEKGANYSLPSKLEFWTKTDGVSGAP